MALNNKVFFTRKAKSDLTNIWNNTKENWSEKQADLYYKELVSKSSMIAKYPFIGQEYPNINQTLKGLKVNKTIIFYRIKASSEIEITRILHERMDIKKIIT